MKLIVGLFDDTSEAEAARSDLVDAGFDRDEISVVGSGSSAATTGSGLAEGASTFGHEGGQGYQRQLMGLGIPEHDAELYAEGVRRNGTVVSVRVPDDEATTAIDIMDRHGSADMDERMGLWGNEGWRRESGSAEGDVAAMPATGTDRSSDRTTLGTGEDQKLEVVEEQLRVGKREVERGGVRVRSRIIETPVEQEVQLRDETVHVERRQVDRPADAGALSAFKEGTIEVHETDEEAVVQKSARVVEEIGISKDVETRTETVRDNVRRTEVDVEQIGPEQTARFREHHNERYASGGERYEDYDDAYRFGYTSAGSSDYADHDWDRAEPQMRSRWEREHPESTWDKVKDAVRSSWDEGRNSRRT
ncbi:MAG: YsnF/AvaK domain-containing protein [Geminicoccaceae bacterium]|nr:YsnF/AvaK domain-containing protein [Geminicoccaceae bacterium]